MSTISTDTLSNRLRPAAPGLLLAALSLWGWQTGFLLYAVIIGLIIELPHYIDWRIELSDKDINQLADLSGVLFFFTIIYAFNNYSVQGIYKILELLPFSLLLLILAQQYSNRYGIKTSALFISIRRLGKDASPDVLYEVNISLPYIFICLIAASAGNKHTELFFLYSMIIVIWILWSTRPKNFALHQWLIPVLLLISVSYVTQYSLRQAQQTAEVFFLDLFEQYGWKSRDPERTATAIGSLGRLKMSDRIVMRIKPETILNAPMYFRETSYSIYEYGLWRNPRVEFDVIQKESNKNEWRINKGIDDIGRFEVGLYLDDQSTIIPAPDNINSLLGKDLIQVETNVYGSTRIEAREGWIKYRMGYSNKNFVETTPDPEDLYIPKQYIEDFKTVASELELYSKQPVDIIATVKDYFDKNFYYSISQNQRFTKGKYLSKFLFETKKGHCEYFATATALLLREAGIPTRYTIGFSVQEYSPWQNMYLVRARHAHSWVQYYINGEWRLLDTTPATWAPLEAEDKTLLEPLMDLFSWLRYLITGSEIEDDDETNNFYLWLLIPLGAYLGWRFYHKKRVQRDTTKTDISTSRIERYGTDSPLYPLIQELEQEADARRPGETLSNWIKRIIPIHKANQYLKIIKLHYRYRFDPVSDKAQDRISITNELKKINNFS